MGADAGARTGATDELGAEFAAEPAGEEALAKTGCARADLADDVGDTAATAGRASGGYAQGGVWWAGLGSGAARAARRWTSSMRCMWMSEAWESTRNVGVPTGGLCRKMTSPASGITLRCARELIMGRATCGWR